LKTDSIARSDGVSFQPNYLFRVFNILQKQKSVTEMIDPQAIIMKIMPGEGHFLLAI